VADDCEPTETCGRGNDEAGGRAEAGGRVDSCASDSAEASTEAGAGSGGRDVADAGWEGGRYLTTSLSWLELGTGCGWVWEQGASEAPEAPEAPEASEASEDDGIFVENN